MSLKVSVLSCCNRARRLVCELVKVKILTCFKTADYVVVIVIVRNSLTQENLVAQETLYWLYLVYNSEPSYKRCKLRL